MPFIDTRLNRPLPKDKEESIKRRLGEAIAIFPGKSEQWLMLNFTDNARLWFRGDDSEPMAMVEVQLLGNASRPDCEKMTARICDILEQELGVAPDHVYVNYTFSTSWGWNGGLF